MQKIFLNFINCCYIAFLCFKDVSLVSSGIQKDAAAVENLKVELSQVRHQNKTYLAVYTFLEDESIFYRLKTWLILNT